MSEAICRHSQLLLNFYNKTNIGSNSFQMQAVKLKVDMNY